MTGCPNDAGTFDTKTCVLACENGTSTYFKNAYVEYSSPNQLGAGFDSLCMPYTTVSGNIQEFLMPGSQFEWVTQFSQGLNSFNITYSGVWGSLGNSKANITLSLPITSI